jgi:hypothetical protein
MAFLTRVRLSVALSQTSPQTDGTVTVVLDPAQGRKGFDNRTRS